MKLFLLLKVCVELCETLQSKFVSESNELGVWDIFLLEITDLNGIRGTKHEDLLLGNHDFDDLLDNFSKVV